MFSSLAQFYTSTEWRKFREVVIAERINKEDGILYDEYSKEPIIKAYDIILHHITPLTMQNVNDYSISLNPANIMIVSHKSHNEIHERFGGMQPKKVYYVYGAPCSGKSSYVQAVKGDNDIVVDMDNIWQCITSCERYHKPQALTTNAFMLRDTLLDMIKTRAGKWRNAYVLDGGTYASDRQRYCATLGAEAVFVDATKETCLERLANDPKRKHVQTEWTQYINKWFDSFQPDFAEI